MPTFAESSVPVDSWQQMTGKQAVHATLGKTFDEIALERSNPEGAAEAAE